MSKTRIIRILLRKSKSGQSLIELLVAISLAAILIPALLMSLILPAEGREQQVQRLKAVSLVKEAMETVRSIRESDWVPFTMNGIFHPEASASSWKLVNGSEMIDGFDRKIVIDDVYRSSSGNIATSGGIIDPSTKKIIATVAWGFPFFSEVSSTIYLTRHKYKSYKETTFDEFNAGTKTGVAITKTDDGEIVLGAGGRGNWCEPNLTITAVDLPRQGVANAISAIEGQVVAGTGENASGVSFANVTINTSTPSGTISGTFDGYKTNGIFGEKDYAYLATDNHQKEIVIIDLTQKDANGKYLEAGYFNAPGQGNGDSIYVSGNIGFMTSGNMLYTFNLSSKSGSRGDPLGSVQLPATGKKIQVVGEYVYVAVDLASTQMQIFQVSTDGTNLTKVAEASIVNGLEARGVFVNSTGTRAYIVTKATQDTNKKEFFILDVSAKSGNPPILGEYATNGSDPTGITVVTGNKAIVVGKYAFGTDVKEYQVVNINDETHPSYCGGLTIATGVNGVASVLESDGDAFSYIITGDDDAELKIIEGGPGGQYASSGIFESKTFDATSSAAFNKFDVNFTKPSLTDIKFQMGIADAVSGACNGVSYTFVGPDGTTGSYFATSSAILFDYDGIGFENPGRCLRYKTFLSSSDPSQTPVFYDITFNFSP